MPDPGKRSDLLDLIKTQQYFMFASRMVQHDPPASYRRATERAAGWLGVLVILVRLGEERILVGLLCFGVLLGGGLVGGFVEVLFLGKPVCQGPFYEKILTLRNSLYATYPGYSYVRICRRLEDLYLVVCYWTLLN